MKHDGETKTTVTDKPKKRLAGRLRSASECLAVVRFRFPHAEARGSVCGSWLYWDGGWGARRLVARAELSRSGMWWNLYWLALLPQNDAMASSPRFSP